MVLYDQSILDDNGKPIFRSKEFDTEDEDHLYGAYDSYDYLFSIKINHGGFFTTSPGRIYYDGKEAFVDFIDGDKFSIHEFNHYVKKLGYYSRIVMYYHYLQPDKSDLDVGLKPFACDRDVIKMVSYTKKFKLIEIYIEHAMSTIGDWEYTGESSVVIEDLTEDNETLPNLPKPFIKYKGLHKPFIKPRKSFTRLLLEGPSQESCENDFLGNVNVETPSQEDENLQQKVVKPKPSIVIEDITDDAPANDPIETPAQQCDPTKAVVQDNQNVQDDGDFSQHMDPSDRVNEVEVDMSKFQEHFQRNDEWLKKSVEGGVGNLEINEEVVGIDFDQYDSGEGSQSDGGTIRKKYRKVKRVVTEAGKEEQTSLHLGQAFLCPKQIKELIKSHAVESRRDLKFVKNEPDRIRVRCFGTMPCYKNKEQESSKVGDKGKSIIDEDTTVSDKPTCPWTFFASKTKQDKYWYVKTFIQTHKCFQTREIRWANSTFLSHHLSDTLTSNPEIKGKALKDQLQKHFQLGLDQQVVYKAKKKAMERLRGDYVGQYASLRSYALELKARNPGTTVKIDSEMPPNPESDTRYFRRLYICLGSMKQGFKTGGRDLLGLDGAFMKGPYPGQVLTAIGVDGNNGIYPLAFGIVEAETRSYWPWFLTQLGGDLDLDNFSHFTFVSDRQKGIIPAIEGLYPLAEHRFCLRHIHENLKVKFKCGELFKEMLWNCATRTTVPEFETAMGQIRVADSRVYDWLRSIPAKHWARSHFSGNAICDILLNNISESFNSKIVDARDQPIITCIEYIREYMMKRIVAVQKVIAKCDGPLTPTATLIFEANKKEANKYKAVWNGEDQYEVKGPWQDQAVVNTTTKVCSCRKWELTGIPCKHAICAIWNMKDNTRSTQPAQPEDWVHPAYRLETWKEVYSHKINPVTGASTWPISECQLKLLPPHHKTQVGRPSKKRRKAADERVTQSTVTGGRLSRAGKTVTCSKCKKQGHNQRKCKGQSATTSSQPKKSKKPKKKTPSQAEGGVGSSQAGATQARASASQQAGNQAAGATQTQGSQVEGSQRSNKRKAGDGEGKSKKQQATQRFAS